MRGRLGPWVKVVKEITPISGEERRILQQVLSMAVGTSTFVSQGKSVFKESYSIHPVCVADIT